MAKYVKKAITVDAQQLKFPTSLTKPTGIEKGVKGDYLVATSGDDQQFIVPKTIFELTYDVAPEPDVSAPMDVQNYKVTGITDTYLKVSFDVPVDSDFKYVILYLDGVDTLHAAPPAGSTFTYIFEGLTQLTAYTIKVTAVDNAGNESAGVGSMVSTIATPVAP